MVTLIDRIRETTAEPGGEWRLENDVGAYQSLWATAASLSRGIVLRHLHWLGLCLLCLLFGMICPA